MPVFLIGGIFGRLVGRLVEALFLSSPSVQINVAGYALVGAVAFASAVTQTISVAVIAVELTGDIQMFLPLLVVAVVAAGISKANQLSIYDRGMWNKGLENFQLLLTDCGGFKYASEVMDTDATFIPIKIKIKDLLKIMEKNSEQTMFPLIDDGTRASGAASSDDFTPMGSLDRKDIYTYLKVLFAEKGQESALRRALSLDAALDEEKKEQLLKRMYKKQQQSLFENQVKELFIHPESFLFDAPSAVSAVIAAGEEERRNPLHAGEQSRGTTKESTATELMQHTRLQALAVEDREGIKSVSGSLTVLTADPSVCTGRTGGWRRHGNSEYSRLDSGDLTTDCAESEPASVDQALGSSDCLPLGDSAEAGGSTTALASLLELEASLLQDPRLAVTPYPFSVAPNSPMEQVYVLFEMVKAPCIFVAADGRLQGMITPQKLLQCLRQKVSK